MSEQQELLSGSGSQFAAHAATPRSEACDQMRNTNFLDTIIHHVPAAIFVKDAHDLKYVFINETAERMHDITSVQFVKGDLVDSVSRALVDSGLQPEQLELEITEAVLLYKSEEKLALLYALKSLGVSIVLDEFGTGYSSLSYRKMFPFDKIKIDQSFVRDLMTRADCAAIVCALIGLGRSLNIVTTAEGVETTEQLTLLRAVGCNMAQGYLFSRPVPKPELNFDGNLSRRIA